MNKKTMYVAQAGMIAAVYAAATLITLLVLQGLAWGPVQFRISEAVCVLAVLTPAAVSGLTVGCIIANLMALAINGTFQANNREGASEKLFTLETLRVVGVAKLCSKLRSK